MRGVNLVEISIKLLADTPRPLANCQPKGLLFEHLFEYPQYQGAPLKNVSPSD